MWRSTTGTSLQLDLPRNRSIPAITVPVALSAAFIVWKILQNRASGRVERSSRRSTTTAVSSKDAQSFLDSSKRDIMSTLEANTECPVIPGTEPKESTFGVPETLAEKITMIVTGLCDIYCVIQANNPFLLRHTFPFLLGGHAFASSCACAVIWRKSKRGPPGDGLALAAAAIIALLVTLLYDKPPWPLPVAVSVAAPALLSWRPTLDLDPVASRIRGFFLHSSAFLTLLISTHLPNIVLYPKPLDTYTGYARMLCYSPMLVQVLWSLCSLGSEVDKVEAADGGSVLRRVMSVLVIIAGLALAVLIGTCLVFLHMALWVSCACLAAFATWCIDLESLLPWYDAAPSSFPPPAWAAVLSTVMFVYFFLCRRGGTLTEMAGHAVDVACWPIVAMTCLGIFTMSVPTFGS